MDKHPIRIDTTDFPVTIRPYFDNFTVYDSSSSNRAKVYYCDRGCFVKVAAKGTLEKEARMNRLFYEIGLGVEVLEYLSTDRDYLFTSAAQGQDMLSYLHDPELLCRILAEQLRKLHQLPVEYFPVSAAYEAYRKLVDRDFACEKSHSWVLMEHFPIGSVAEAQSLLRQNFGKLQANCLIHGDACLPNVILKNGQFSSFIDFDQSGLGDRHIDLFWAIWSLQYNLKTEGYTDLFLRIYGKDNYDPELIRTVAALEYLC